MDKSEFLILSLTFLAILPCSIAQEPRIVCYYRKDNAQFNPENINPQLCTHLIYAYGAFTETYLLKPADFVRDIDKGGYTQFAGLKMANNKLKTLISIGGSNEGSSRFSALCEDGKRRINFGLNVVTFLRENNFDGLDLNWVTPTLGDGSKPEDRQNYAQFAQDINSIFDWEKTITGRPRLLLTLTVPAAANKIDQGYDLEKFNEYIDWYNILSYEYHDSSGLTTNHLAPLYSLENGDDGSIDFSINYLIKAGADRKKLVLGIPTFGRSYTLSSTEATGIGAPANGPGIPGAVTGEMGFIGYLEICQNIQTDNSWRVVHPNDTLVGPYVYKDDQWICYDDENIVRKKSEYVAQNGLGGIMFWSIDTDDYQGFCTGKPYPLIEAAKESLLSAPKDNIFDVNKPLTTPLPPKTPTPPAKEEPPAAPKPQDPRIVCYYRNDNAQLGPQNINPHVCTHLVYAFGTFTETYLLKPSDPYQDIDNEGYIQFTGLKINNTKLKTLISIGGPNEGSSRFSILVSDRVRRATFAVTTLMFLRKHNFDGLDLNWITPAFGDGSNRLEDRANLYFLAGALGSLFAFESKATGQPRLLVTLTVPAVANKIDQGYDFVRLNKYIDWYNVLSYDYYELSDLVTHHHAPLLGESNSDSQLNIDFSINYLIKAGADRNKLVVGISTYGRSYTLASTDSTDIGAPAIGPGIPGNLTGEKGFIGYFEICQNIKNDNNWRVIHRNNAVVGPYVFKNDQWISYDDENIVREKSKYVAQNGLGGIMFWSLDTDDFGGICTGRPYPLIEAAREILLNSPKAIQPEPSPQLVARPVPTIMTTSQLSVDSNIPKDISEQDIENEKEYSNFIKNSGVIGMLKEDLPSPESTAKNIHIYFYRVRDATLAFYL